MDPEYKLRGDLIGHQDDVRAVIVCDLGIVTASRDKTIKIWKEADHGIFSCSKTLVGHTDFVTALAYRDGTLVSGSRDQSVIVWDLDGGNARQRLRGHQWAVTAVGITEQGKIVSASLDKTVRIWSNGSCEAVLEGHTGPVQCLLILPTGHIASGSGDCTIRIWKDGHASVLKGHTDTVRGLALVPNIGFVSASHDMTLRLWDLTGQSLSVLVGHEALIYSAAGSPDGFLIASASEDKTCRLWGIDGALRQTIPHPGCVWDVAFLENGDLVTACGDSIAHVWTADDNRVASPDLIAEFSAALEVNGPGAGKKDAGEGAYSGLKTEDISALLTDGRRDGEQKFVKEADGVFVYVWNMATGSWDKLGQVTTGPEETDTVGVPSNVFNGQTYDFVVPVELQGGPPNLKIAFNRDENPYDIADRWLVDNNMPAEFRPEIVEFILQVTGRQGAVPSGGLPGNADPFTGGGSYVPGFGGASYGMGSSMGQGSADPFTGGGAYVPGGFAPPAAGQSAGLGNVDPFTGGGAYAPGSQPSAAAAPKHIPQTAFVKYDSLPKAAAVANKIREFNTALAALPDGADLALGEADVAPGGPLDGLIARAADAGTPADYALLERLLRWPWDQLFPALDLARLAALSPAGASALASSGQVEAALRTAASKGLEGPPLLVALRFLCNTVLHPPLQSLAEREAEQWLDLFGAAGCGNATQTNVRQAWAAVLLNLAVLFKKLGRSLPGGARSQMVSALFDLLSNPAEDPETTFRCLAAVGTLATINTESREYVKEVGLGDVAQSRLGSPGRAGEAARELLQLLA